MLSAKQPITTRHPLLEIKGVSHNFDYPLFENINLSLKTNETIAIVGVSGSGKSTLLNIFCSLLTPNSGEVIYDNHNIFNIPEEQLLRYIRQDFGIIFQSHYLFRGFDAYENLQIASLLTKQDIDKNLLKELKIEHIMRQGIGELSGGQSQRLSIARVMTKKPKIIFADEPTGNLDNQTALDVMNVLFDYVKLNDAGMIIVTHDDSIAYRCNKVYKLNNNKLEQLK